MIVEIGMVAAVLAIIVMVIAKGMAAKDTGLVVNTNAIYQGGGDPGMIYMVAEGAITPGDNVEPGSVATSEVKACDASAEEFTGTADLNILNATGAAGGLADTTDFGTGDIVGVFTGPCQVKKVAEDVVGNGKIVRPGTTAGTACRADTTSTAKYTIGRCISWSVADGEEFIMRQW